MLSSELGQVIINIMIIIAILLRQTGGKGISQVLSPRQVTRLGPIRENPGTQLNLKNYNVDVDCDDYDDCNNDDDDKIR